MLSDRIFPVRCDQLVIIILLVNAEWCLSAVFPSSHSVVFIKFIHMLKYYGREIIPLEFFELCRASHT